MICCHYPSARAGGDGAFTIDASRVTFGRGCIAELGDRARSLGMRRVALFTDPRVATLAIFERARRSLVSAGLELELYDGVRVEPTSASFEEAARFALGATVDGFVSVGGGSVLDTAKAASLLSSYPAPLRAYANLPVGEARPVPGPLRPHLACPTTSGTGSEVTGIAVYDDLELGAKTAVASARLRPTEALIDPDATATLPAPVVAASGFDVLSHALESFTARAYCDRPAPERPTLRPMSQGKNPFSDLGCREALTLCGDYLLRAVADPADAEAREAMMWAATLAGVAFGSSGVHVPHAMAYAVAGLAHETSYRPAGYPEGEPLVPHGVSVVLSAPAVFRLTAETDPERHLEGARRLGAETRGASARDAGQILASRLAELMQAAGVPNGLRGVGYDDAHVSRLVLGTVPQARLLSNAPLTIGPPELERLFHTSMRYW